MTGKIRTLTAVTALVGLVAFLLMAGSNPAPAAAVPSDPQPLPPTGVPWRDQIYYGAAPSGGGSLPVLVFVHGMGGIAQDWWGPTQFSGTNDMYTAAYNAGYRTAFVNLNDTGERWPLKSMWQNGRTLARQIGAIADYYGVATVDLVTHSKGGVDSQAAVAHYGAASRVRNIFMLSSPNHGSEIADLGFDTALGRLILGLLGWDGAGNDIYLMTTSYMARFRELTDPRTEDDAVNYYWAGGTDIGPQGSPLRMSGRYLSRNFGPNDGLVTVASAELAGSNSHQLFVQPFNHDNIRKGSTAFPYIDAIARQTAGASLAGAASR